MVKRIGLISDTHGLLREEVKQSLARCDLIIHAGDIGTPEVLKQLQNIAKVIAVKGNVDTDNWTNNIPITATIEFEGLKILAIHSINKLEINSQSEDVDMIIYGHSHRPEKKEQNGVMYINPGSVGPRRFNLPISFAILKKDENKVEVEFITL